MTSPKEVLALVKEKKSGYSMDFPGIWQHFSVPVSEFELSSLKTVTGLTSIRGWQLINASDMLVIPDAATAKN
ncbi:MAG: glutamine synthetase [Desulfobacterales bacterium]